MDWGSEAEAKIVDFLEAVRASGLHFSYAIRHAEQEQSEATDSAGQPALKSADPPALSPRLLVDISGEDASLMTERGGELLHALESLAASILRLAPEQQDELCFDALAFREGRRRALDLTAQSAIDAVRSSGEPFAFAPMNSRERRMLHLVLAVSGLPTASSGEGPRRFVVLYPAGMKPTPERFEPQAQRRPSPWDAKRRRPGGALRPGGTSAKKPLPPREVVPPAPMLKLDPNGNPLEEPASIESSIVSEEERLASLRRAFRKR